MAANDLIGARYKKLGTGKVSMSTATTTTIGSDINVAAATNYVPGDRILVVFTSTTAGTTDSTGFVVQTAPDSSGSIGTPVAATTDGTALTGGTGDQDAAVGVRLPAGHQWIRVRATRASGTTDTTVVKAVVYAVSRG